MCIRDRLPAVGGTLLVNFSQAIVNTALPLSGAPGVPGAGGFALPLPIPDNAGLVGLTIYAQSAVIDGGGPFGFALSQGLSSTLCL